MIEKSASLNVTPYNAVVGVFYEPAPVFAQLESRRFTWFPVLLLIAVSAALAYWYFQFVDFAWMQEHALSGVKDAAEREQRQALDMSQQTTAAIAAVSTAIAMLVSFALSGLYFMIVGKVRNMEFSFGKGFALAAWASVPYLLLFPLGAMQIMLASNNQITFEALNPLSFNQLFFRYETGQPLAGLLDSLSIPMIWTTFLLVIGYQIWAKTTRATAVKIVLLPYAVVYGIWLAYALSQTA